MLRFDFSPLIAELDNWPSTGSEAAFWWRDDDAVSPSEPLNRLLDVAAGRPLALAVIPLDASPGLAKRLERERHVAIFQHGWRHKNHASSGPNSEYPAGRSMETVNLEFNQGSAKLADMFGDRFAWVFTPPWHGLDPEYRPLLASAGIHGVSSKGVRSAAAEDGLQQNNIHCVPVEWTTPASFGDPQKYVDQLVTHLVQRRSGIERDEATGILTHHLVQTPESLDFVGDLLTVIERHPNARLADPFELFPRA